MPRIPRKPSGAIAGVGFNNPRLGAVGIDVFTLDELRTRARQTLLAPQRVAFYFLMLVQAGRCRHTVDFVDHALVPGSVVFLRPGQVQQWQLHAGMQGLVVLVTEQTLAPSVRRAGGGAPLLALDAWPAVSHLGLGPCMQALGDAMRLRDEVLQFAGSGRESAILWHSLMALLLRLAQALGAGDAPSHAASAAHVYRLFRQTLETAFHQRLTVLDFAQRLGYSQSTLARACLAVAGTTAKQAIDQRTALEAKRLLVHSDSTVAHIGHQLGFAEPTNFVKFFRRTAGSTPQDYRRKHI